MNIHMVLGHGGGAGRSLTAALIALEHRAADRKVGLVQLGLEIGGGDGFEPGEAFPVPVIREELRPAEQVQKSDHPALSLTLHGLAPFTEEEIDSAEPSMPDLVAQWRRAIARWALVAEDIVIDLPALSAWQVWPLLHSTQEITIPVRSSPLEIEAAIRSFTGVMGALGIVENRLQPHFARIVPEPQVRGHADNIAVSLADHDPAGEFVGPDEPIAWRRLPFLDETILKHITEEREWWEEIKW